MNWFDIKTWPRWFRHAFTIGLPITGPLWIALTVVGIVLLIPIALTFEAADKACDLVAWLWTGKSYDERRRERRLMVKL